MINEYNNEKTGNTGNVTITPYGGENGLPASTTITVQVNNIYPTIQYENIKHPED